jgi:rhodanese-related sulfurtransferase
MSNIDSATLLTQRTDQTVIVDVREADEYAAGHVPGAINVPLSELVARHQEIPDGAYLICQTGSRSAMATEFLNANGHHVTNILGGTSAWPEALAV